MTSADVKLVEGQLERSKPLTCFGRSIFTQRSNVSTSAFCSNESCLDWTLKPQRWKSYHINCPPWCFRTHMCELSNLYNHICFGEPKIPWSWPLEWPLPPSLRTKSCSMFGSRRCQHWMFPVWQGLPVETGMDVFFDFSHLGVTYWDRGYQEWNCVAVIFRRPRSSMGPPFQEPWLRSRR